MKIMNKCTGEVAGSSPVDRARKVPVGTFCVAEKTELLQFCPDLNKRSHVALRQASSARKFLTSEASLET
ncbi:MAG TPA: hypothetical protein VJG67_01500 [Candidatus Paceibacterota bacterium]